MMDRWNGGMDFFSSILFASLSTNGLVQDHGTIWVGKKGTRIIVSSVSRQTSKQNGQEKNHSTIPIPLNPDTPFVFCYDPV